jgi:chaperone required for assembly of F1-ATPase
LHWLVETYHLTFQVTDGLMPIEQPADALHRLQSIIMQASDAEITALAMITPLLGSVLLAVALWQKHITVDAMIHTARLDETHHAKKWGEDEEARAAWVAKEKDIRACAFFLTHHA